MSKSAHIHIQFDGSHVRSQTTGPDRLIGNMMATAAMTDPRIRAACILATVEMFRHKDPELAAEILVKLEIEAPTAAGRKLQMERAGKLLAA